MESIKILCFGDSLTEGYSQWGMCFTPYAKDMKSSLEDAWKLTTVNVDVNGLSGDLVGPGLFLKRITKQCQTTTEPYDWIVILGGTNDLGHGFEPGTVFANLQKIYQVALDHGANVLALTVPECAAVDEELDESRYKLNTLIKERKGDRFHTFDLHAVMPYHSMSNDPEGRDLIWDDGLHFTAYGYSLIGDYVASRLVELVAECTESRNSRIKTTA